MVLISFRHQLSRRKGEAHMIIYYCIIIITVLLLLLVVYYIIIIIIVVLLLLLLLYYYSIILLLLYYYYYVRKMNRSRSGTEIYRITSRSGVISSGSYPEVLKIKIFVTKHLEDLGLK